MKVSYDTLAQLARAGDVDALNMLERWEKVENPAQDPTCEVFFLLTPVGGMQGTFILHNPKERGNVVAAKRTATLMGIPAAVPFPSFATRPDIIITDEDGDID